MTPSGSTRRRRQRGEVETLPSGSLRVRVYAGVDPISGKRHYLSEVIPAGKDAAKLAEKARTRMQSQVDERRSPRSKVTVDQLMDRYLGLLDVDVTTRAGYEGYIRNHVRPLLGHLQVGKLDGETLDSFYAILRRCRAHCDGRPFVEHRTASEHTCDAKCRPHTCRPLAASSVRQVHFCLSGALKRAVRWHWIGVNPLEQAEPPRGVKHDPQPPSAEQAAAIINSAFSDVAWGVMIWLAMTTGARRGELCALRWNELDLDNSVVTIKTSIGQNGTQTWEKDTKTHQQRRITLDENTVTLMRAYRRHCEVKAASLGLTIPPDGRVFSTAPDHTTWIRPSSITQRYSRMCARLGWDMHIHQLRHYSATELISAGVDVRTVAGRLGHGGGGSTTLRVYSAWVSESDQKAAGMFTVRMPALPVEFAETPKQLSTEPAVRINPHSPYEQIAADLRGAIMCGAFRAGDALPSTEQLKERYRVSSGTASRAIAVLKAAGLVSARRGHRVIVT